MSFKSKRYQELREIIEFYNLARRYNDRKRGYKTLLCDPRLDDAINRLVNLMNDRGETEPMQTLREYERELTLQEVKRKNYEVCKKWQKPRKISNEEICELIFPRSRDPEMLKMVNTHYSLLGSCIIMD